MSGAEEKKGLLRERERERELVGVLDRELACIYRRGKYLYIERERACE